MTSQQLMKTSHLQVSICCKCLDEMPGLCSWGPEEGLLPTLLELPRKGRGRSMLRASLWENGCVTGEGDLAITVALGIQNSVTIVFELAPSLPLVGSERKNRKWAWKRRDKDNALSGLLAFTSLFLTCTHARTRKFTHNLLTYTQHRTHSTHACTYIHSICGDSCVASTYCDAASLTTPAPALSLAPAFFDSNWWSHLCRERMSPLLYLAAFFRPRLPPPPSPEPSTPFRRVPRTCSASMLIACGGILTNPFPTPIPRIQHREQLPLQD